MTREGELAWDYNAEVHLRFAEDLTYLDVAPALDEFTRTPIFTVRATRDAWSGPAAGGPEIGLVLEVAAGVGLAVFAKTFCEELAKDVYKAARGAVLALIRQLRDRDPERRRAVVGLQLHIGEVRICVGPVLNSDPKPEEWTDDWLLERLGQAQMIINDEAAIAAEKARAAEIIGPADPCKFWLE